MKKQVIIISLFAILLIALFTNVVMAADSTASATLKLEKTKIKQGENFKVTINVKYNNPDNSKDGIDSFMGQVAYDKEKLDLTAVDCKAGEWYNFGGSSLSELNIIHDAKEPEDPSEEIPPVNDADVATLTFKVKANGELGKTKISIADAIVSPDLSDEKTIANLETEIEIEEASEDPDPAVTLSKIEIKTKPTKTSYTEGEKFDPDGMKVVATYSDGTTKEVTSYTYSPSTALKTTDKKVTITYTENGVTRTVDLEIIVAVKEQGGGGSQGGSSSDGSSKKPTLPNTGVEMFIVPIIIIGAIAGVSFVAYKKNNQI